MSPFQPVLSAVRSQPSNTDTFQSKYTIKFCQQCYKRLDAANSETQDTQPLSCNIQKYIDCQMALFTVKRELAHHRVILEEDSCSSYWYNSSSDLCQKQTSIEHECRATEEDVRNVFSLGRPSDKLALAMLDAIKNVIPTALDESIPVMLPQNMAIDDEPAKSVSEEQKPKDLNDLEAPHRSTRRRPSVPNLQTPKLCGQGRLSLYHDAVEETKGSIVMRDY